MNNKTSLKFCSPFQVGRVALVSYLHVWTELTCKASNQFLNLYSSLGNSQSQTVLSAWSLSPLWFGEILGCWLDYRGQTNRFSEQHVFSCDAFSLKVSVLHDICSLHLKIRIGSFCIKAVEINLIMSWFIKKFLEKNYAYQHIIWRQGDVISYYNVLWLDKDHPMESNVV